MFDKTLNRTVYGTWNRQQELLQEAARLHLASRAVREARARRSEEPVVTAVARPKFAPRGNRAIRVPNANGPRAPGAAGASSASPGWRAAAARFGTSLVKVGKRLEHYGERDRG